MANERGIRGKRSVPNKNEVMSEYIESPKEFQVLFSPEEIRI